MMKKVFRKSLIALLSVFMACTLVPMSVFAADAGDGEEPQSGSAAVDLSSHVLVVEEDQTITDATIYGNVYIKQGATLSTVGEVTINGSVYVFGTFYYSGTLNVTGAVHCLHCALGSAIGDYDYGYFQAKGSGTVNVYYLDCSSGYLSVSVPEQSVHIWDSGEVIIAPTCTEEGETLYTCIVCGATKTTVIDALGHTWIGGVVIKEPTETEEGIIEYTCEVCGETKEETIPALDDTEDTAGAGNTAGVGTTGGTSTSTSGNTTGSTSSSNEPYTITASGTDANDSNIEISVATLDPDENDVAKGIINAGSLTETISGLEDVLSKEGLSVDDLAVNSVVNVSAGEEAEYPLTVKIDTGLTSENYKTVLLAHYDEETGTWTYVDATWDGTGTLTYEAKDESDLGIFAILAIANDDSDDNNNNNNNNNNNYNYGGTTNNGNSGTGSSTSSGITSPQTSEQSAFGLWTIVAAFGAAGCVFFVKYMSSKSKEE